MDLKDTDIKQNCKASIDKILGLITQLRCPNCGAEEFFRYDEYIKVSRVYEDKRGCHIHSEELNYEYDCTIFLCKECGYSG